MPVPFDQRKLCHIHDGRFTQPFRCAYTVKHTVCAELYRRISDEFANQA